MENILNGIEVEWATLVSICGEEDVVRSVIEVFLEEGVYTLSMIDKAVSEKNIADLKKGPKAGLE